MNTDSAERPDSRRSWVVAVIGAVAMIFTFGTPMSYGIFREPFSDAFGLSPVALSGVFAIMLFTFFVGSGLVGVFGVRFPARAVLLACSIATGVLAPSLYLSGSAVWLTVVFAVLGLALGTVFVLLSSIVPRWFETRRSAATGLIFVGNGLGLFVLPPIWQLVLTEMSVRRGFLIIISVHAIVFFFAALACRRPRWAEQSSATAGELLEWLMRLGGTRTFRLLFIGVAFAFAWYQLLAAFAVDLFIARGLSETAASAAFGLIGGFSIISRIGGGYLGDVIGVRRTFLSSLVCTAVGIGLLFIPLVQILPAAIFLIGLGLGATATLYIPLLLGIFSSEKDTAIVGVFNVAAGIAALGTPPLGTASVDYTGGFTIAILLTFVVTIGGIWTVAVGTAA